MLCATSVNIPSIINSAMPRAKVPKTMYKCGLDMIYAFNDLK